MKSEVQGLAPEEWLAHNVWMNRLARRLVFGADSVDDLVQEAWTAALANPPSKGVPLRAWLAAVIRRTALFQSRSDQNRRGRESEVAREARSIESIPSSEELTARADQQRQLLAHLNELPEKYREALLLRYFEDLKPKAIAAHLGLPLNSVKTLLQRGLERLRQRLDQEHAGDRRAWSLALVPLAALDKTSIGLLSTLTSTPLGAWIMAQPIKTGIVGLTLLFGSIGLWQWSPSAPLDLRQYHSPEDLAELLFPEESTPGLPAVPIERAPIAVGQPTLRGQVLDLLGNPIEGASIQQTNAPMPEGFVGVYYTMANIPWGLSLADGTFEGARADLAQVEGASGEPWLEAVLQGYVPLAKVQVAGPDQELNLRLAKLASSTLEVEVIDRTSGNPVPRFHLFSSAQVPQSLRSQHSTGWLSSSCEVLQYKSQLEIEYIEGLPIQVSVNVLGLAPQSNAKERQFSVEPIPGGKTTLRIELNLDEPEEREGATLAFGRVLDDQTGEPIPGAEIWVHPHRQSIPHEGGFREGFGVQERRVQSLADGRFRIAIDEGGPRAAFSVYHPLYQESSHGKHRFDGVTETEIRLSPRGRLELMVMDSSGQPLADVPLLILTQSEESGPVTFALNDPDRWRCQTDKEGRVVIQGLRDGRYHAFVLPHAMAADEQALASASYLLEPGEVRDVVLQLDAPERVILRGMVSASTQLAYPLVPSLLPYAEGSAWTQAKPSAYGYQAGGMQRGEYLVLLGPADDDHDGPYAFIPNISIDGFGEQVIDFVFPTGSLEGYIERPDVQGELRMLATPIVPAGFAHDLLQSDKLVKLFSVPVDGAGRYDIRSLADGRYRLDLLDASPNSKTKVLGSQEVEVNGSTRLPDWRP